MPRPRPLHCHFVIAAAAALLPHHACSAVEISGLLDVRVLRDTGENSWTQGGLGKTRSGGGAALRLGQGSVAAELDVSNAIAAIVVADVNDERSGLLDLQEAFLAWNPVPEGPWQVRAKAGLFFPPGNEEIDYARHSWTPRRTISASAINSWLGEEFKTKGIELNLTHRGRASGSPHDAGVTLAVFNGNDPAGTLLAWRGWSIGDRLTGASETLQLADLPVYRSDGAINKQTRDIHLFRELDGRPGYYLGVHYAYADRLALSLVHYDNRGDPLVVKHGQYSWATKFDHVGLQLHSAHNWDWSAQYLTGSTMMGPAAAALDYRAWYVLASHPLGRGTVTVRYDRFYAREHDIIASDPNGEHGSALALAHVFEVNGSLSVVTELLAVRSDRPARMLIGERTREAGNSVTASLRWQF